MEISLARSKLKPAFAGILSGAAAFVLGTASIAEGVKPFGISLICAVGKEKRKYLFAGALLASLTDKNIWLSAFCAVYIFIVLAAKEKHGGVFIYTRVLLALSASALRAVYIAVGGIGSVASVFSLIAAVISYPAFTYAFRGRYDRKKELRRVRYEISLLAFAFAFTAAAAPFELFGVNLGIIPAAGFTLCAARRKGFAFGGICGTVCGLVAGGAATGALGVMGMAYGLLAGESEPLAVILGYMLSVSGYYYLAGAETTPAAALMLLAVTAAFYPLRKKIAPAEPAPSAEKRAMDRRMSRYAATFSSLSSLFYSVSDAAREQSVSELNADIVKTVDERCGHCAGCELDKSEITNFFTREIRNNGVVTYARMPSHITYRCPNAMALARSVNGLTALRHADGEKGLKRMADEYSAFSAILSEAAKSQEESRREDRAAAREIKSRLAEIGVTCDGVRVSGTRRREVTVFGVEPEKISCSPADISGVFSGAAGTKMSDPELVPHDDYTLLRSHSVPRFRMEYAKFSEAKSGEQVCGDTVSVFESDENRFFCLVSDGMGSGRDAALTSRLSAIMLEKLLCVGAEKESALKLLNKALSEKQEEVFATVDLLEIDRITGKGEIIKAGAAPSILIRGGKSYNLESRTPPAGIMKTVIADKKTFEVRKGDMIVMMSDGIMQTGSEKKILPAEGIPPMPSARALAEKILRDARDELGCGGEDDMSVCVIRVY